AGSLVAGTDGSGSIEIAGGVGGSLNGNGDDDPDTLVLQAADTVRINGVVGDSDPLEGLTIEGADVTFVREVTVNGDLVIHATGTVTFTRLVTLTGGGDLRVVGAGEVIFSAGVRLTGLDGSGEAGDLFLEA